MRICDEGEARLSAWHLSTCSRHQWKRRVDLKAKCEPDSFFRGYASIPRSGT